MLIVTVEVAAPAELAQGVKEALDMYLERFGDSRVVRVEGVYPRQLSLTEKGADEDAVYP